MVSVKPEEQCVADKGRAPVRRWTAKEDETLRKGVLSYLRNNQQPKYSEICKNLSFRTVKQAKERWRNSLNPSITKGLWSTEEVVQLLDLIIEKGENWTEIQHVLSHRSMHCIKSKGRKLLGEAISKKLKKACNGKISKVWEDSERAKLLELHQTYKYDMEAICFALQTGKSMAEANREMILRCPCESCTGKLKELQSTGMDFKLAWAVSKAKELKAEIASGEFNPRSGKKAVKTTKSSKKVKKPKATPKSTSRKRSFSQISAEVATFAPIDSDCSSDLGSLDYDIFSEDEFKFGPLDYDLHRFSETTSAIPTANSLYDTVMKDAQAATLNFSNRRNHTGNLCDNVPHKKMRTDAGDFTDFDYDFQHSSILDNNDDFFLSIDPNPVEFYPVLDNKPLSEPRRASVINAMDCIQHNQCISVN